MKIQPLIDKFLNKWPTKVICVVIALLLYFFYNISQLNTKTFSAEVYIISNGQMMAVSSYQKHVKVTVRARPEDIATISSKDIMARLNLNPYTAPGKYDVPVTLDFSPEVLLIDPFEVRVSPDSIPLQIEDKTFEYKDIQISFADEVPHGYEVVSSSVEPSSISVTGSRSAVEQTTKLYTNRLSLANHTDSFSAPVTVASINSLISLENDGKVVVSVKIAPIVQNKEYTDIPVSFVYLKPGLQITDGGLSTVSFTVSGELLTLEALAREAFSVVADCSEIHEPGEYDIPLKYQFPDGAALLEKTADTVKIVVQHQMVLPEEKEKTAQQ